MRSLKDQKVLFVILSTFFFVSLSSQAQTYLISDGGTVTTCSGTIYDSGGPDEDYSSSETYQMTFCADDPAACLQLEFISLFLESNWDSLFVYAGPDASGSPFAVFEGDSSPGVLFPGSECITLVFDSDGSVTDDGFEIEISCLCPTCDDGIQNGEEESVDCGGPDCPPCNFVDMTQNDWVTMTTCDAIVRDNGGASDYSNNSTDTLTICSGSAADCIQLDFLLLELENNWDSLWVYAGPDATGTAFAVFEGASDPGILNPGTECVTLVFDSDGSVTDPGFEIAVSCACPSCNDGILNGQELDVDCGGPDCPDCPFIVMGETQAVGTCDTTIFDNGYDGNYALNSSDTLIVCSDDGSSCMQIDFISLDITGDDHLYVYDGGVTGALLADISNSDPVDSLVTSSGCFALVFESDDTGTAGGYELDVSCSSICPTCVDGIQNGFEEGIDCGGPDCPECTFVEMPVNGWDTITSCDVIVFDSGGQDENYENFASDTLTICSGYADSCLVLDFLAFDVENGFDDLFVYLGQDVSGTPAASFTGTTLPDAFYPGTSCITLLFESDFTVTREGFEIQASCTDSCATCDDGIQNGYEIDVDCGGPDCPDCPFIVMGETQTVSTCDTTIYDNGYNGDYAVNSSDTLIVCAADGSTCMQIDFISLDITGDDHLYVYDGEGTSGGLLADISNDDPETSLLTTSGCFTLIFESDGFGTGDGYELEVSCSEVCPTCDDGIQNGLEIGVDCGGPDCPECPFIIMDGTQTVTTCSTTIYDNGFDGNYSDDSHDILTVCSENPGECLQAEFISFQIEGQPFDTFTIYAGPDTDSPIIGVYGDNDPPTFINAGTECLTFEFISDGSVQQSGYEIEITCACPTCDDGIQNGEEIGVDCGGPDCPECPFIIMGGDQTVTTCSTTIYDNGFDGTYAANSNDVLTVCSENPGECIQAEIISFEIEGEPFDTFTIYAGPDTSSPIIGTYGDEQPPTLINAGTECLTFEFISDGSIQQSGYEINISCVCPSCDDGIMNGEEEGIDCGGPDCPECDFIFISDEETITNCSGEVVDSGGASGDYGPDEDYTMTLCSDDPEQCLVLDFSVFETEDFFDVLDIYAGETATGNPIASFDGNLGAFVYESEQSCITLHFTTGSIVELPGFRFSYYCQDCLEPTEQDCLGANVVCSEVYVQEDYSPEPGLFPITLPPSACLDNADNAIWYTFTVQESGLLSFILTPEQASDDYDWGLFDLTDATCYDIPDDPSLLVSCNSYGQFGDNGPTGISTANGGTGNVNGPGDTNGPPFNADYNVVAGETYALLVQNWTGSNDGYTLDFSSSTADLFEAVGPDLENVEFVNCGNLLVDFATPVDCSTLDDADFTIESDSQVYAVDSISSGCGNSDQVSTVELFVSPAFPDVPDSVSISFVPGPGVVQDLCGNPVPTDTVYEFLTPQWLFLETSVVNTTCDLDLGSITIDSVFGGVPPYVLSFEGVDTTATDFTALPTGVYTIHVIDNIGCQLTQEVPVGSDFLSSELDTLEIDNCATMDMEFTADMDCSSLTPESFTINSNSQVYTVESISSDCVDGFGQSFSLTISPNFPDRPDTIWVTVNGLIDLCGQPIEVDSVYEYVTHQFIALGLDIEPTECLLRTGSIEITNVWGTTGPYTMTFEDEVVLTDFFAPQLGIGTYPIEVTDSLGCHILFNAYVGTDNQDFDVQVSNVFSPNGDDLNPLFGPASINVIDGESNGLINVDRDFYEYSLRVFNRWGREVFVSNNSDRFWDGTDSGGDAAEGTYYFILQYHQACTIEESSPQTVKGFLNLFR